MKKMDNNYLTGMPSKVFNRHGISKTLLTRKETIYMKHVFKNLFVYNDENQLNEKLGMMNMNLFQYMQFTTNKMRGTYKITRDFVIDPIDDVVKTERDSFFKFFELYEQLRPIVVLDFDKTITNKKFHSLYMWLSERNCRIYVNSANPQKQVIEKYFENYNLPKPNQIFSNKGKRKKITSLKNIALQNQRKPIFYIDDEVDYLDFGVMLFMYCYEYRKNGKIYSHTFFEK